MNASHQSFKRSSAQIKYEIRSLISLYPELFYPLVQLKSSRKQAVSKNTDITIEGFPRCGNSFAVNAFREAQPHPLKIADHLHASAQVIRSAQLQVPTLVMIREPTAAVISLSALALELMELREEQDTRPSLGQLLRSYTRFYQRILPYRDYYVLGTFEEVTRDFGEVINKINKKLNTNFTQFEHNENNVKAIFQATGLHTGPSSRRNQIKSILRKEMTSPQIKSMADKAHEIYEKLMQTAS